MEQKEAKTRKWIQQIIKEELQKIHEEALIDKIYDVLGQVNGFNELGLDQQGELSMKVVQLLKQYGLK